MIRPIPAGPSIKLDFSSRDVACFLFALSVHSLLLLWKGGLLVLPDQAGGGLGDMLVSVDFRSDVPSYEPAGGGSSPKAEGLFARMKSIIKGPGAVGKKSEDIAMGAQTAPIAQTPDKPAWTKTDVLTNKTFADKKGFEGMVKKDALDVATGQTQNVVVKPSAGNFEEAQPNLKENKFKIARKDVPFKIVSPKSDQLANANAIAVNVDQKTSANVRSLDGGPGAGPALQSKSFASKGASTSGGFGGTPSGLKSGSGGGLAMGSASVGAASMGGGSTGGTGGGGGSGYGSGAGTGSGSGSGNGFGSGTGGGRLYGGGSGFGSGGGSGGMATLARNTVSDVSTGGKSAYNSGFNITGALANRPIISKVLARYEMDCRVGLRFRVDWAGRVIDGIIVEISSGSPTFDQKVVAALQQWVFSKLPADKTNVIQEGMITFVFKGV